MPSLVKIGLVVLEKKNFFKFVSVFSLYQNYLPPKNYDTINKNYGTLVNFGKPMVLWKNLWYYIKYYGTLIYYGKNYGRMEKKIWYYRKL